ncbi:MAG: lytic murein transglycosylase [Pseudomonadota bacterium]
MSGGVRGAFIGLAGVAVLAIATGAPSSEAEARSSCKTTGTFSEFKSKFRRELQAAGITPRTLGRAFDPTVYKKSVMRRDRRQSIFSLTFIEFSQKLISTPRFRTAKRKMARRNSLFARAEAQYGVPREVITAFWALESDFGATTSKQALIFSSLATLAYDCRRPDMFRKELLSALRIVDKGYLPYNRMTGSWAGELGQTQFLPSHYLNHSVDADGDGYRDLNRSDADIIFSTANYIRHLGWRRGEPWLQEVRVPAKMNWAEADLAIRHTRQQWSRWGVRRRDGQALRSDGKVASLLLPMGRNGPAFLAYDNFRIYPEWNQSLNYATTAAYFAARLAGAPRYRSGNGEVEPFGYKAIKRVQRLLTQRGYDTGGIDGKHGAKSRAAVKAAQLRYGLEADSYPDSRLVRALQRGS